MTALTKDELLSLAVRLTKEMSTEGFLERVRARLIEKNTPPTQAIMDEFEGCQIEAVAGWGFDGPSVLRQLKLAVKNHPGVDTQMAITQLCDVEEQKLVIVSQEVAARFGQTIPEASGSHGHSHNGKPCHGHGHDHGHNHGSHGHSHNGQPCHGHGAPSEEQMMTLQMALESLSPQQKADMERLQQKMMTGQQPTPQDQKTMMEIQQQIMAYVSTMQQVMQQQSQMTKKE